MALVTERPLVTCEDSSWPVIVGARCLYSRTAHLSRIRTVADDERGVVVPPQGMAPSGCVRPVTGKTRYLIACRRTAKNGIVAFCMTCKSRDNTRCFLVRNE